MTSDESVDAGFAKARAANGQERVLVNCAGTGNAVKTASRGKEDGSDVSYNNTHVSGGKQVNVVSGGDLNIKGAVIDAPRVNADVGGSLNIESLRLEDR